MKKKAKLGNVLLGVCGGIAAYKSCELVRILIKSGFSVKVMMTEAATKFVSPLVFQALSKDLVYLDMFQVLKEKDLKHIALAQWAKICVIAPLSANTLSKIAGGICDNLLTTVICALPQKTKVILAPAMNENMWKNAIIVENVEKLSAIGACLPGRQGSASGGKKFEKYIILPPQKGELACGAYGEGRMSEITEIYKKIKTII